jgi:CHAT domain-containing protein
LSDFPKAIDYFQQALVVSREIKRQDVESNILNNIGNLYYNSLNDNQKAIDYWQQSLEIAKSIKKCDYQAINLEYIGNAYNYKVKKYQESLNYYQQALLVARELKDKKIESRLLSHLGNAYKSLEDKPKALEYFQQFAKNNLEINQLNCQSIELYSLGIRNLKNRGLETSSLANLGYLYRKSGQYQQAINWLIKPVEAELKQNKVQNLVFSLDRATRYIPISALFDGKKYVVENYTVSTILSASLTDTKDRLPPGIQNTLVLGMGLSEAVPGFRALLNVPSELDTIVKQKPTDTKGIYPGEKFLNKAFDFPALRNNLRGHKILHMATHGVFLPGSRDDSFLMLGTGEKLTIPQIETLQDLADVHLVVLSACQTGLGEKGQDGVEINGVGFYFIKKGAKAVLASLWSVNDSSTSQLMQQFYSNLASNTQPTKVQALRQAQLSLLHGENSTRFSHPYYWAPFILIGNGL